MQDISLLIKTSEELHELRSQLPAP